MLTTEMYTRSGAIPDESEGLIEYLQAVKTVECAFLLESLPDGLTRASLRSRGTVDVPKNLPGFGGGGHRLAAGLRTKLPRPSWNQSSSISSRNNCRNDAKTAKERKETKIGLIG